MYKIYKKKFAVTHIVENDEEVIAIFDDKLTAIEYGKKLSKTNGSGVLSCVQSYFDDEGNMQGDTCLVFEVWE